MLTKPPPMMQCGHAANARLTMVHGQPLNPSIPSCAICSCTTIDPHAPDLTDRRARCSHSRKRDGTAHDPAGVPSSTLLAFFRHHPGQEFDEYYCGCWGWD